MNDEPESPHNVASGGRDHPRQTLHTSRPCTISGFSKRTERDPTKGTVQEVESSFTIRAQHVKRPARRTT